MKLNVRIWKRIITQEIPNLQIFYKKTFEKMVKKKLIKFWNYCNPKGKINEGMFQVGHFFYVNDNAKVTFDADNTKMSTSEHEGKTSSISPNKSRL